MGPGELSSAEHLCALSALDSARNEKEMKKVLIGCAITVGVVMLVGIGGSFVLIQKLKDQFPDMKELEAVEQELVARDGEFESEIMPLDGSISPEMMDRYMHFQSVLHSRAERDAQTLQNLVDDSGSIEKKGTFGKLKTMVSGGLSLARASVEISAVADSLLLVSGLTRGECVYMTALVRFGVGDFEAPRPDDDPVITGEASGVTDEVLEVLDDFEETLERRAFILFANQRRELRGLEAMSEREEAWLASLEAILEERPRRLTNLRGQMQPWQIEAVELRLEELRRSWPATPAEYYLELIPRMDESDDENGVQIQFGD
jgi:hypothetical protein